MTEMSQENAALGIGEVLRAAREQKQQPLADISALLKIREDHLQALEDENFAMLPGDAYAIGFIRTYANHLGLNSAELVTRFKESREKPQFDETSFEPDAEVEPMSALLKVGIGVTAVFVVYLAWLISSGPVQQEVMAARSNANDDIIARSADETAMPSPTAPTPLTPQAISPPRPVQPALRAVAPSREPAVDAEPSIATSEQATDEASVPAPATDETARQDAVPPSTTAALALPPDAASAMDSLSPQVSGGDDLTAPAQRAATADNDQSAANDAAGGLRVEIRAKRRTWMRLENNEGRVLFSSIISPGDSFPLQDDGNYTLATRDAGALEFSVNGRAIGNVGRRGQILTSRRVSRDEILTRGQ